MFSIFTDKQRALMLRIAHTGFYSNIFPCFNTSKVVLDNLIKNDFIKKDSNVYICGSLSSYYTLTNKGRLFIKRAFAIEPYISKKDQINHDYKLALFYAKLTQQEKETWMTERDIRRKYPDANTVCDGAFKSKGELIGVEIFSDSYSTVYKKAKKDFMEENFGKYIII